MVKGTRSRLEEASARADADQAAADREVASADATPGDVADGTVDAETTPKRVKKPRNVKYSVWGKALSNEQWDYVCDQPTIGKARSYLLSVMPFARKTYSALRVTRTKLCGEVGCDGIGQDEKFMEEHVK
jgi:hypothetical protein